MQQPGFLDRGDDGIRLPQVSRKRLLERDASELGPARPDLLGDDFGGCVYFARCHAGSVNPAGTLDVRTA